MTSVVSDSHRAGTSPGSGTFSCLQCGSQLALEPLDTLPRCPGCGASDFRRSSLFEQAPAGSADQTAEFAAETQAAPRPGWLAGARRNLAAHGRYLAFAEPEVHAFALDHGWTRIGRSGTADIRLDDPSVSRRHALVVWEEGEPLRVLDDRSLNGIRLNGELIEWGTITDGDELAIGSYRLFLLEG